MCFQEDFTEGSSHKIETIASIGILIEPKLILINSNTNSSTKRMIKDGVFDIMDFN